MGRMCGKEVIVSSFQCLLKVRQLYEYLCFIAFIISVLFSIIILIFSHSPALNPLSDYILLIVQKPIK